MNGSEKQGNAHRKSKGTYFTPWKAGIALSSLALAFLVLFLAQVFLPGEMSTATKRVVGANTVFVIESKKNIGAYLIFVAAFFSAPLILFGVFWKYYVKSYEHKRLQQDCEAAKRTISGFVKVLVHSIRAILIGLLGLVLFTGLAVEPYFKISTITIDGEKVFLESCYSSWTIRRSDIGDFALNVEAVGPPKQRLYVEYIATIQIKDATKFVTWSIKTREPNDDKHFSEFFDELEKELMK